MASIFDELTAKSVVAETPASDDTQDAPAARNDDGRADIYTPRQIKDAALELLKYGLLEERRKPNLYRGALAHRDAINRILEPLDLAMKVDDIRGLAHVAVVDLMFDGNGDEWSHPLVRRQRFNLEQSLLVAILRHQFVAHEQEAGVGSNDAMVSLDDLLPHLQLYFGGLGSDAQEQKRLRNLLEQLKVHGIVSDIDEHDQVFIRPIIAHLANPENLQNLLVAFRHQARQPDDVELASGKDEQ